MIFSSSSFNFIVWRSVSTLPFRNIWTCMRRRALQFIVYSDQVIALYTNIYFVLFTLLNVSQLEHTYFTFTVYFFIIIFFFSFHFVSKLNCLHFEFSMMIQTESKITTYTIQLPRPEAGAYCALCENEKNCLVWVKSNGIILYLVYFVFA